MQGGDSPSSGSQERSGGDVASPRRRGTRVPGRSRAADAARTGAARSVASGDAWPRPARIPTRRGSTYYITRARFGSGRRPTAKSAASGVVPPAPAAGLSMSILTNRFIPGLVWHNFWHLPLQPCVARAGCCGRAPVRGACAILSAAFRVDWW